MSNEQMEQNYGKFFRKVTQEVAQCVDGRQPVLSVDRLSRFRIEKGVVQHNSDGNNSVPDYVISEKSGYTRRDVFPQMLGGSIEPALHYAILKKPTQSEEESVRFALTTLVKAGIKLGMHQGEHCTTEKCECGFCQNKERILQVLIENEAEIFSIIRQYLGEDLSYSTSWEAILKNIQTFLDNGNSIPTGNSLQRLANELGAKLAVLEDVHDETAACINFVYGTSLDTFAVVKSGTKYFNRDAWYVQDNTDILGLNSYEDRLRVLILGCALYLATEIVLVEQTGNPRLPIYQHGTDQDLRNMLLR